jgi:endonuclease YncB( thermonuclease family)
MGSGGAVEVSLYRNVDGDTSFFIFPDELDIATFVNPDNIIYTNGKPSTKVRYQDINTPETYAGGIEEWGWPAKLYTAKVQSEADKIYVQSVLGDSLLCTYGRIMGYVFANKGDESICVNFMIIKQGYSRVAINTTMDLKYKDVPYYGYLNNAMIYAQRNGLGLHGDALDPYWDYVNNKSIYA